MQQKRLQNLYFPLITQILMPLYIYRFQFYQRLESYECYDSIIFLSSTKHSPLLKLKSCRFYFCLTCITESVDLNLGCSCFSKCRAFLEVSMISLEIIINVLMGNIIFNLYILTEHNITTHNKPQVASSDNFVN